MKHNFLALCIILIGITVGGVKLPTSAGYHPTDIFFNATDSSGSNRVFTLPQSGGLLSTPFGNVSATCNTPLGILASEAAGGVIVGCWGSGTLEAIQMPAGGVSSGYATLPSNCHPEGLAFGPDGNIYVSCDGAYGPDTFDEVNAAPPHNASVVVNLAASGCVRPHGITLNPANKSQLIVACFDANKLIQISGKVARDYAILPAGCGPIGVTSANSGDTFVVCSSADSVYRVRYNNGQIMAPELYAKLPSGCGAWGIVTLSVFQNAGDYVVPCIRGPIYLIPSSGILPLTATYMTIDSFTAARFITTLADSRAPSWDSGSVLTTLSMNQTSVTLTWTEAVDDVGVVSYRLYQGSNILATVNASARIYTVTGLSPGATYVFRVQASDAAGNWSTSGPSITVILPASPTVPSQQSLLVTYLPWLILIAVVVGFGVAVFFSKPKMPQNGMTPAA